MSYFWQEFADRHIRDRFPEEVVGPTVWDAWRALVAELFEAGYAPPVPPAEPVAEPPENALDRFMKAVGPVSPRHPNTSNCVFISHQQMDVALAMRVACLASKRGLQVWLDVLNPTLALVNGLPNHDPRRSILIAAIVEIGLLKSSHVIALHTTNSRRSRWVPYEFGRAKAHYLFSLQAAGWFEAGQDEKTCGDYVQLAVMCADEKQVERWLDQVAAAVSSNRVTPAGPSVDPCTLPGGATPLPVDPPP